eukprot:NODE_16_length_41655_cov_0.272813.p18 type:complete len:206 gc:universal NODE_16_length_41655_cov_0.272813:11539-12156(+)
MGVKLQMTKLSTKKYWDEVYEKDLILIKESKDSIGEIWFGEDVEQKVVNSIVRFCDPSSSRIIDIGTGNGSIPNILNENGYNCVGMDYSEKAIELCNIAFPKVKFFCDNILTMNLDRTFNVVVDKGTLDAIYLSKDPLDIKAYAASIDRILENNGLFFITSCNMLKPELESIFLSLNLEDEIPYPKLEFGGSTGQCFTSLVFRKY